MEEDIEEQLGEPEMETLEPRTESELRSGISSVVSGMETPDIELQKRPAQTYQPAQTSTYNPKDTVARPLYQVLETTQVIFAIGIDILNFDLDQGWFKYLWFNIWIRYSWLN